MKRDMGQKGEKGWGKKVKNERRIPLKKGKRPQRA